MNEKKLSELKSFEFRYFKDDQIANGETDFKGETSIFDIEERLDFLNKYASYAKDFFQDQNLDKKVVSDEEARENINNLKEQPLPQIRKKIPLKQWRWLGYRKGQRGNSQSKIGLWQQNKGIDIIEECLTFSGDNITLKREFPDQTWRFFLKWKVMFSQKNNYSFALGNNDQKTVTITFARNGFIYFHTESKKHKAIKYNEDKWYNCKIEVDLTNKRYNVYINGTLITDFVKLEDDIEAINSFFIEGVAGERIDNIWGVGYLPEPNGNQYTINTFIDENFVVKPSLSGWQQKDYDDKKWKVTDLPKVHGSERHEGEDLYLRKTFYLGELEQNEGGNEVSIIPVTDTLNLPGVVPDLETDESQRQEENKVDKYERAVLEIESLDPGGEVWVNGEIVTVITNRHPQEVDISNYLQQNDFNVIAVKVNHFKNGNRINHAPTDENIGWFAGRIFLNLTKKLFIEDVFVYTEEIGQTAQIKLQTKINNQKITGLFKGEMEVNFYHWYHQEDSQVKATTNIPFEILSKEKKVIEQKIDIPDPQLWTFDNPHLYKVEVILKDENDREIDDYVITTGIRTISQEGGTFRINGEPEMLNGALIMGYRSPLEKIALWHRCAPEEWLVKEIEMVKKMRGNTIRVHVHGWKERNINDPRLAEIGDQMGIMFIWATTAWIRTDEPWRVDFAGYPQYIRQVRNHPSIVMWEATNHPNRSNYENDFNYRESNLFFEKVYNMIYSLDASRLISPTAHLSWFGFGNDTGSLDKDNKRREPLPAYTAPMMTRGNMEQITGYSFAWSRLRKWPISSWRGGDNLFDREDFLASSERAYFNFETEESIGQPNWNLQKGKPSYHKHSYEWEYDEGTIGRKLDFDEWLESQSYQAFSAYESLKKQRLLGYDGMLWCSLHGGANTATYEKPVIDYYGHAKLAFYSLQMAFNRVLAGSDNVDVVYGPDDKISPVIININREDNVTLEILVKNIEGKIVDSKIYKNIILSKKSRVNSLSEFKPEFPEEGYYALEYHIKSL